MKPYPKYKDSGAFWIGKVPENWKLVKTKYVFSERVEKGYPNEPLLAATQTKGVVPKSMYENRTVEAQKDLHLLKLVTPGDFVISLRSFQGGIEYSKHRGIISPAYTVMIPNDRIFFEYFRHLAKSKELISLLKTCVTGIREGQNINYELLRKTPMPIPPESEQIQIACYLDWQTEKIKKFIKNKKKLIALLKEQKQNIINEAVTKGINPNVKMKNSGVEWIGEIPMHWEALYIRRCTKFVKTGGTPKGANESHFCEKGFDWFTPSDFKEEVFLKNSYRQLSELGKKDVKLFPANTVMMIGIGGTIGKVSISPDISSCNQQINAIFTNERVVSIYMTFALRCLKSFIIECGKYTTMPIINQDETKTLKIPVPPISEQQEIVAFIEKETALIDKTIARTEKEIELIQEYRTRLVSDVVTGKIDVRDVEIPDFVEETVEMEENEEELNEEHNMENGDE
ncbi:MAG TPA: restriction endonuclease subunit S [bacterium]|nr:restriction endonuclease subunit S [bacterium]